MFKRAERKRKRREEEEELGLDEDTRETLGLNDTDSDESDSDSEQSAQSDSNSDALDIGDNRNQEGEPLSKDEAPDEETPISLAEVLKDPVYLISLDPTVYGCVLCKGKLIKNAGMATAHKSADAHKRRFQHFKLLFANADPRSNAWELVRAIRSTEQRAESQELSKRTLKRVRALFSVQLEVMTQSQQAKQAAVREKRNLHKQRKAKAIAKKAIEKSFISKDNATVPSQNSQTSPTPQTRPRIARKKQKLASVTSIATLETESRDTRTKSPSRTKTFGKKTALDKKLKSKRKPHKLS